MRKVILGSLGVLCLILMASPWILIVIGRNSLHPSEIPIQEELIEPQLSKTILAFFPHPDDEVTVAGTLMKLKDQGHSVFIVMLTKGEAGNSGQGYTKVELAEIREKEMRRSASILGVDSLYLLNYPDSGLENIGLDSLQEIAQYWINKIQPEILISYDSKVGLYGHSDHRLSGLAIENVFIKNQGKENFSPKKLFQVTLSRKQINIALKLSEGFKNNYPKSEGGGLPKPDFSVNTQPYFHQTLEVMGAHYSQRKVLKDLMPFHDRVPAWIYSRIFDREYFHEVKN